MNKENNPPYKKPNLKRSNATLGCQKESTQEATMVEEQLRNILKRMEDLTKRISTAEDLLRELCEEPDSGEDFTDQEGSDQD